MPSEKIRVLIVDDHASVRYSLSIILELCDDLQLIGEAANGKDALALCQRLHPDVVLMDLLMPVMDGVTTTKFLHEHHPDIRVLILTSGTDPDLITAAMEAGAQGYLEKHVNIEVLAEAIRAATT